MKTTVILAGKTYPAAPLTVGETTRAAYALASMGQANAEGAFERIAASLEVLAEVLLNALRKANADITAQQLREAATPNEILLALGVLIPASLDPSELAGRLLNAYQAGMPEEN